MKTSQAGIDIIKRFEGFRAKPYLCSAHIPTIGYGTTVYPSGRRVTMSDEEITESEACVYIKYDLERFERAVSRLVKSKINQNQFDALVSFTYNLGDGALEKSTLLKKVNANPLDPSIKTEFGKWIKAGGNIIVGLINRRKAELNLYFKPIKNT